MTSRGKVVLQVVVVAVIGLLLGLLGWRILDRQEGTNVASAALDGEKPTAPDFTLPELDGTGEITLSSLRGNVVVVNFWASWCPPCKDEAPALQDAWERWQDRGVVVLGVDTQDLTADARAFVDEYGITYPNVRDGANTVPGKFGVVAFPETVFIDADGKIAVYRPGPVDAEMIENGIESALAS
jgi:cytochrome c biogenesis protein CcmG, thiol:disulfide interchange protein DsbE